jgi:hypothetical protein
MSLPDRDFPTCLLGDGEQQRPRPTARRPLRRLAGCLALAGLVMSAALPAGALGRKVKLVRKYRNGQRMVYQTQLHTQSRLQCEPPSLQNFLPPLPADVTMRQQTTVTVQAVHADGAVDIQNRFDEFDIQTAFPDSSPQNLREAAQQAQEEIRRQVPGQVLTAHYDRAGHLLGFDGADELLGQLDAPLREPLRQALRLFLEQLGGNTIYPGHPVKRGEAWKRTLSAPASSDYPFQAEGESMLHYLGKTKYRGIKAAIVDFQFQNKLTPVLDDREKSGAIAQLQARGMGMEVHITGQGSGRMLLALDDGRVLENHATLRQTMTARLHRAGDTSWPEGQPVQVQIQTETKMDVEGSGK